jgi:hypothetical protein
MGFNSSILSLYSQDAGFFFPDWILESSEELKKKRYFSQVQVAHACNPSNSGGRNQPWAQKYPTQNRAGGVEHLPSMNLQVQTPVPPVKKEKDIPVHSLF